jgi:hypothetical protein
LLARTPVDGGPQFQQPNPDGYVRLRLDPAAGSVAAVTAALALQRPFGRPVVEGARYSSVPFFAERRDDGAMQLRGKSTARVRYRESRADTPRHYP